MSANIIDEFVEYLTHRHFNAENLLAKLNSTPRRNGEKTLRDLWEASDLSANDFADAVAGFYRLSRIALPQLIAAPSLAQKFSRRFLRETLVFPFSGADGDARLALADPNDVAAVRAAEIVLGGPVGIEIASYEDDADGVLDGKRFTSATLRPRVRWAGEPPEPEAIEMFHDRSHKLCFIANSVDFPVAVEPS